MKSKKELGLAILLVVLCAFTAMRSEGTFLSPTNLQNTARLIGMYGIFSLGVGFVIITGGIDLSIGSVIALLGVLLSFALGDWHLAPPLALLFVVGVGALLGLGHGLLIAKVRLQPFIVTLCGLLFYRGIARFVANDETKGFSTATGIEGLQSLATGNLLGVPTPFVFLLVLAAALWVLLHRSTYGRHLMALGSNENAARYAGIHTDRLLISVYVLCSLLAGVAAVFVAFYTNSISPSSHGNFYELYGIAAAVLGGCSLRGGEGSVVGILIGTALLQVLQNLVNLLGIPSSLNFAVMGAVILAGVAVDQILSRRAARKR
jgi:Ribose/xylose/arabinose/galactoside ABC-type transport systems, permease components